MLASLHQIFDTTCNSDLGRASEERLSEVSSYLHHNLTVHDSDYAANAFIFALVATFMQPWPTDKF